MDLKKLAQATGGTLVVSAAPKVAHPGKDFGKSETAFKKRYLATPGKIILEFNKGKEKAAQRVVQRAKKPKAIHEGSFSFIPSIDGTTGNIIYTNSKGKKITLCTITISEDAVFDDALSKQLYRVNDALDNFIISL